jgi:hypothetical protein
VLRNEARINSFVVALEIVVFTRVAFFKLFLIAERFGRAYLDGSVQKSLLLFEKRFDLSTERRFDNCQVV